VRAFDLLDTRSFDIDADLVINATGPWAGRIADMADVKVAMRPGKGVHVTFERRIGNYGLILEGVDGRVMFLVPHGAETIVGTTDTDYYGDPGRVDLDIHRDEVAYVIEAAARALPQAKDWRPIRAWAGVRNTLFEWGVDSDDLSRRHEVLDHATRDNVGGLLSVLGGKLAAYRIQSEEAVDLAMRKLGRRAFTATTGEQPLPGASPAPDFLHLARELQLPAWALERVWRRVGDRVRQVFAEAGPDARTPICRSEAVTGAEIRYAIRVEGCRTLEDLRRHTHVGAGGCDGVDCAIPSAHLMAELLQWPRERIETELEHFLNERWIGRRPVLNGATLAQEEVWRGVHDYGNKTSTS
jgi:glycerol-3-phosphate dehydrogenase